MLKRKSSVQNGQIRYEHSIWYTGRDSNPQPSEPESDALSIEPPVHLLYSLDIITGFYWFVKGYAQKYFGLPLGFSGENGCFLGLCMI